MLNLKITNEKENKLLDRKEIEIDVLFDGPTPKKSELTKEIASLSKAKENLIKIKKIKQIYGTTKAHISSYIYNSVDSLNEIEPKIKKKEDIKGSPKEEKKQVQGW